MMCQKQRYLVGLLLIGCLSQEPGPAFLFAQSQPATRPPIELVDPFLGVDNGGNTTPAAGVPFGFVRICADTLDQPTSGYNSAAEIVGFSHTHVSGTGGASKYGNFQVTPIVGKMRLSELSSQKSEERASPGYYMVKLSKSGIIAELTATRLAGMHRYTFPVADQAHLLIDVSSLIKTSVEQLIQHRQKPVDCQVRIIAPNRIEGTGHFVGGWNPAPYTLHFAAEVDPKPVRWGTWIDGAISPQSKSAHGERVGSYFTFESRKRTRVHLKVGISFISTKKASTNLDQEIPDWNFERIRSKAERLWTESLSRIQVYGGTNSQRQLFYSCLFRAHYMPHDLTGENMWWTSDEPHYEDFYCLWDTFRTLNPLLTVVEPERERDMIRSLIDTYLHTGWMPDARIAGTNGMTQGGSNSDVVIADAAIKGLSGFDYVKAYEAMAKNAEVDSPRPLHEGRELGDYLRLGYISMPTVKLRDLPASGVPASANEYKHPGYQALRNTRSASRTMEYAYNDFCVAQMAWVLGRKADQQKYLRRSRNWTNLWDEETRSIRPRFADGRWLTPFSPIHNYPDEEYDFWDAPFYEGNGWQYTTYVPHDVQGLIKRFGGREKFVTWLDEFFEKGVYNPGNEPDFMAPYLYIHAGRPDRTADRVREILSTRYATGRAGLPGNDDAGAMSAWYIWGAIGLYPNAGQDYYYIGSPIFPRVALSLGDNKTFTIDAQETSSSNRYVQSVTLNGRSLTRPWLRHSEIARGGHLVLTMGSTPSPWGRENPPFSLSLVDKNWGTSH